MALKEALAKKGGLTLAQLASYDDVITDALVDRVYFWTTIRKNRARFSASRGVHEEQITDILRKTVVLEKDPQKAVADLLQLVGLRNFSQRLATSDEREHFKRHLRKYVNIYMPDCPFEVTTTNRYMISTHEASITARKKINKGEEIKYLTGVQVSMTKEQEENLDLTRKDFSIVISSRKKTRSLFLGPARFANHDCDANARLTTKGAHGMQIVSVKTIEAGDEITVSYGDDYFGDDNEECLCHTCELKHANGWDPDKESSDSEEEMPDAEDATPDPYALRRKRKYGGDSENTSRDQSPASPESRKRQRLEVPAPQLSPARRLAQPLREAALRKAHSTSSLRQEVPVDSIEHAPGKLPPVSAQISRSIRNQQRDGSLLMSLEASLSRSPSPHSPSTAASPKSSQSTDATSVDDDTIVVAPKLAETSVTQHETSTSSIQVSTTKTSWSVWEDDAASELTELSSSQELDDVLQQIVARKRSKTPPVPRTTRSQSRRTDSFRNATPIALESIEPGASTNERRPGDYTLTPLLLCAKFSRWVQCRTCDADFVQEDAYLTRAECPRCERHSKIYGYAWPKTDKEGKHDKEERVLDHRTIHRFVEPQEERAMKKGRKSFREQLIQRYESSERERTGSLEVEVVKAKVAKKSRKRM